MGADGWIDILDMTDMEQEEIEFIHMACWHVYEREIFGRKVMTIYADNCDHDRCCNDKDSERVDEIIDAYGIDCWEVWT